MDKFMNWLQAKVIPRASKIASERHLAALRDAMVLTIPFIIIGSIFLILASFPIPAYTAFLTTHASLKNALMVPYNATFNIVALVATYGVAYRLAKSYQVDGVAAGVLGLAAYFIVTPQFSTKVAGTVVTAINTSYFSSQGLFVGLIMGMLAAEIYRVVMQRNITIKMPDGVPPTVAKSFTAIIPGFFVVIIVWGLRLVVESFTPFGDVHTMIQKLLTAPLTHLGTSFWGTMVVFLVINLLWCIGLHGSIIANSVMLPIWLQMTSENAAALAAGRAVPHIVSAEFRYLIFVGGSGATLGLVIAMAFFAKSKQLRQLGRLGLGPGIFGINEPVLFGLPVVFNPLMWIPFLIMPLVSVAVTYGAMYFGIVSKPIGVLPPGTTPPLIGGYLMTGNLSGSILQLVILILSFVIYWPFFKLLDKQKLQEEAVA